MLLATKPYLKFAKLIEDPKHLFNKIEESTEKVCSSSYIHFHLPMFNPGTGSYLWMHGLYRAVN